MEAGVAERGEGSPGPEAGRQRQPGGTERSWQGGTCPSHPQGRRGFADARVIHEITAHLELFKVSSSEEVPKAVVEECDYNI